MSRKGHCTDFHFDYMTNFTLQLKGSKTWKFRKGQIHHPVRGATPHYKEISTLEQQNKVHSWSEGKENFDSVRSACTDASGAYEQVTLHEGFSFVFSCFCCANVLQYFSSTGDFLFHPAGIWHRVECEDDAISLNISLMPMSWGEMLQDVAQTVLLGRQEYRAPISGGSIEELRKNADKVFSLLKKDLAKVSSQDFLTPQIMLPRDVNPPPVMTSSMPSSPALLRPTSASPRGSKPVRYRSNPLASLTRCADSLSNVSPQPITYGAIF